MGYKKFNAEILPSLRLPRMSQSLLTAFRSVDVKAEKIASLIEAHPYYLDTLRGQWLASRRVFDEAEGSFPRTEVILVQLGMESARNFLIAVQAGRSVGGQSWRPREVGNLGLDPRQIVRHAIRAESVAASVAGENPAFAYAGGLLFDLLALRPLTSKTQTFAALKFEEAIRAAQIASALGRRLPDRELRRYLFGAALVASAGPVILAHLNAEFIDFDKKCTEQWLPSAVAEFAVRQRLGVRVPILTSLAAGALGVFGEVERALLFTEQPYLARSEPTATYLFAATLRLALNIARHPRRIEKDDDPWLEKWKGLALRELPISHAEIAEISRKMTPSD